MKLAILGGLIGGLIVVMGLSVMIAIMVYVALKQKQKKDEALRNKRLGIKNNRQYGGR